MGILPTILRTCTHGCMSNFNVCITIDTIEGHSIIHVRVNNYNVLLSGMHAADLTGDQPC